MGSSVTASHWGTTSIYPWVGWCEGWGWRKRRGVRELVEWGWRKGRKGEVGLEGGGGVGGCRVGGGEGAYN